MHTIKTPPISYVAEVGCHVSDATSVCLGC